MTETPQQSTSWGSLLAGLLVGAAVGAGLSLLYAPKPGHAMREDLMQRLDELKAQVDETTHTLTEMAKHHYEDVRMDLSEAIEGARATAAERARDLRREADLS